MQTDIIEKTNYQRWFDIKIQPRMEELAKHMGNFKQITVMEMGEHMFVKDVDYDPECDDYENIVGKDYCYKCLKYKLGAPKYCISRIGKRQV